MAEPSGSNSPIRSDLAGDPEMKELIELFLQELPARIDSLKKAHDSSDFDTLKRMAHQLRGASAGYGFPTLGTAAGKVEDRLRALAARSQTDAQSLATIGNEINQLVSMCRRAVA